MVGSQDEIEFSRAVDDAQNRDGRRFWIVEHDPTEDGPPARPIAGELRALRAGAWSRGEPLERLHELGVDMQRSLCAIVLRHVQEDFAEIVLSSSGESVASRHSGLFLEPCPQPLHGRRSVLHSAVLDVPHRSVHESLEVLSGAYLQLGWEPPFFVFRQPFVDPLLEQPPVFGVLEQAQSIADHFACASVPPARHHFVHERVLVRGQGYVSGLSVRHK